MQQSEDEQAMLALNSGDYARAQELLEKLIADEPAAYFRYPRLATTYAIQGGFDLTNLNQIIGGGGGGGTFIDTIGTFLPTPDPNDLASYRQKVTKIELAKNTLRAMPDSERVKGANFYGASASLQLLLYQAAFSVMFMNQFAVPQSDGKLDPAILQTLTIDDALKILSNLRDSAALAQGENAKVAEGLDQAIAKIESQQGTDERERMLEFLQKQKQK